MMAGCSSNVGPRISQLWSSYQVKTLEGTVPTLLESSEPEENVDLTGRPSHCSATVLRA
jgi:hypothetical protein